MRSNVFLRHLSIRGNEEQRPQKATMAVVLPIHKPCTPRAITAHRFASALRPCSLLKRLFNDSISAETYAIVIETRYDDAAALSYAHQVRCTAFLPPFQVCGVETWF